MSQIVYKSVPFEDVSLSYDEDIWVKLEQKVIPEATEGANLSDIFQMMGRSASGLTSYSYSPTSLDYLSFNATSIRIDLGFWLFPSHLGMPYTLTINQGSISQRQRMDADKMGNIVVPMSDRLQMPYLMDCGSSSFQWQTPVYDPKGNLSDSVSINCDGSYLVFDKSVFGIIRGEIQAQGYYYIATLTFPKTSAGIEEINGIINNQTNFNSITNINASIICTYIDENNQTQETVLEFKIPDIVSDVLEECPDDSGNLKSSMRQENCKPKTKTIYYSTCDGEVIDTVRSDAQSLWCDLPDA